MSASLPSDINQSVSLGGCDKPDKPTTSTASAPFDDPKADLIIRSSDNIHFYVHKSLLSIVSPVFEGMLALPDDGSQEFYDNRPCLPFSDDSLHLFCLLSWCDPRSKRPPPSLDNLAMALAMAEKYKIDSIFAHAQKDLLAHEVESRALSAFAIAIRFRLEDVAQRAARETLRVSLAYYTSPHLEHISASALQNLHNYHFECKTAAQAFLTSDSWTKAMKSACHHLMSEAKSHTHGPGYFSLKRMSIRGGVLWISNGETATWWCEYVEIMMHNLNERPSSSSVPKLSELEGMKELISLEKCSRCKKYGYGRLDEVSRYLASKFDEVVSESDTNKGYLAKKLGRKEMSHNSLRMMYRDCSRSLDV